MLRHSLDMDAEIAATNPLVGREMLLHPGDEHVERDLYAEAVLA
ncbi:hypothetical protein [Streptomyces sp. NPDC058155]